MAHYKPIDGIEHITGALSKKKIQGVNRMTVTRRKSIKDPLTGEVVGMGQKEIYAQNRRDYNDHPLTLGETRQLSSWTAACRLASVIIHDKSHPRYLELYHRWRAHLKQEGPNMQFPNFIRSVLSHELSDA